ncbi:30S ribosomal protein S5 [Candidatus Saccharibacteria bacterium]|nr:30S ribosomal protein S5 [Candidatus Saccharibacteria bacterium]MCB9821541.1 30S ribosomal protein S5 [Candidatus Nomurabacteria bacterium]
MDQRVLAVDRVARVVKGGRRFRFRALVCLGDKQGSVGVGSAKGADVTSAITKAVAIARKNMIKVSLKGTTLPHEVQAKVGGAKILIKPAPEGTGLIAGSVVREILDALGVANAVTKSLGNNNKTNASYACIEALQSLVPENKWVTASSKSTPKKETK